MTAFPARWLRIKEEAKAEGLDYGSEPETGALLRSLAASKPGGSLLELGTAIGLGTAWLLDGMDARARLTSVDIQDARGIAKRCLGDDPRLELVLADASIFLRTLGERTFDLIFADAPPGKLFDVDLALDALAPGGVLIADDMIPDPSIIGRREELERFNAALAARAELMITHLSWSTGIVIATRRSR